MQMATAKDTTSSNNISSNNNFEMSEDQSQMNNYESSSFNISKISHVQEEDHKTFIINDYMDATNTTSQTVSTTNTQNKQAQGYTEVKEEKKANKQPKTEQNGGFQRKELKQAVKSRIPSTMLTEEDPLTEIQIQNITPDT